MKLAGIHPDDIVRCNIEGRVFHAFVTERPRAGEVRVRPLERGISWRHATARQVVAHWRRSAAGNGGSHA
jgi:hypothetical protein